MTRGDAARTPSGDDAVLSEIVQRLRAVYDPLRIYLFGSAARGDAGPNSDYDLMVILPDDTEPSFQDPVRGYVALGGLGVAKDLIVWTNNEFQQRLHLKSSLPSTVVREGKLLYAA